MSLIRPLSRMQFRIKRIYTEHHQGVDKRLRIPPPKNTSVSSSKNRLFADQALKLPSVGFFS